MEHYDAIVIGTGGGLKLALAAADLGMRVALFDEDAIGGTCLNRGCIPSKMLIYPCELADTVRAADRIDLLGHHAVGVNFRALVRRTCDTIDEMSAELRRGLETHRKIAFLPCRASFAGGKTIRADGKLFTAEHIFIATGSRPYLPPVAGLDKTPYMTSREALRNETLPRRLIVVGAGYIAAELGYVYGAAGCEVTFIVRSRFLRVEDREVARELERAFRQRYAVHDGWVPRRIDFAGGEFAIHCEQPGGAAGVARGDALLIAAGVRPCTEDLGLENTRVEKDRHGRILVDDGLRTAEPGVYACGDVIGRHLYRHTVNYEAEYLIRTVLRGEAAPPLDYGPVPHAVFTRPEIAAVGPTEEQLQARGVDYVAGRAAYGDSNQGLARGSDSGFVKILVERATRRLLAAHIVGEEASNMIHMFVALMKKEGTLDDLLDMIFVHPALPELARDAARDARSRLG